MIAFINLITGRHAEAVKEKMTLARYVFLRTFAKGNLDAP